VKISNFAIFLIFSAFLLAGVGSFLFSDGNNISRNYEITISREKKEIPVQEETKNNSSAKEEPIKAVYATSWSVSKDSHIYYLTSLALSTEINAVVIDIKDFSGYITYDSKLPQVKEYLAKQVRTKDLKGLIEKLHGAGLYVIARMTVFQDPRLALARPILGIHSKEKLDLETIPVFSKITLWKDRSGLAWIDPAAKEAWEYNAAIAKEAISLGFDEINFDYIRFPSDGDLRDMVFPFWGQSVSSRHMVIKDFFKYLREELPEAKLSVDLFGLSTISHDDLGVGQIIEDAFWYFDYISPMVYPSHYASGFSGFENPGEHPYEVILRSMESALSRLNKFNLSNKKEVKLRPWLQDFSLAVHYSAEMVKKEIEAVQDSLKDDFAGFMLWSPNNIYTKDALSSE